MVSTIGIVIDVVIVLAVLILGVIGYKKGFLHSVLSLFSWTVCIVVAVLVAKYVAGWINGIYDVAGFIGSNIEEGLVKSNEFFAQTVNSFAVDSSMTTEQVVNSIIANIPEGTNGLLVQVIKLVFTHSAVDITSEQTIASFLGSSLGQICLVILSGILVFIVLMIAVALLRKIFDKIAETKILGGLNKILGLGLGLVKAVVIIVIVNCVMVGLSLIPAVNKTVTPVIQENTYVEKFIYNKTDELVGKYFVEGEMLQEWINSLWEAR